MVQKLLGVSDRGALKRYREAARSFPYRTPAQSAPDDLLYRVRKRWHRFLPNQTAARLWRALRPVPKIVATTIPLHLPALARTGSLTAVG